MKRLGLIPTILSFASTSMAGCAPSSPAALLFVSARWGDTEGIFDSQAQAQDILHTMLHKQGQKTQLATNMFNRENKQVVFVPSLGRVSSFTDPSYHLPPFVQALWDSQTPSGK